MNDFYIFVIQKIKLWGEVNRDSKTGYGHGIPIQNSEGYEVGNPTAYRNEVIAGNIILPEDIRTIVVGKNVSILGDLSRLTQEQTLVYLQQAKHKNLTRANEDILANARLFASLANNEELNKKIDDLEPQLESMKYGDLSRKIIELQKEGLKSMLGSKDLNEENLRQKITEVFNIQIQSKP